MKITHVILNMIMMKEIIKWRALKAAAVDLEHLGGGRGVILKCLKFLRFILLRPPKVSQNFLLGRGI